MQEIKSESSLGGPLPSSSSSSMVVFTGKENEVCELEDAGKGRVLSDAGMLNRIEASKVSSEQWRWNEIRSHLH